MSDSSSEEEFPNDWIMYSKRPEWSDIQPLEQDDGEHSIVQIAYSSKFRDVFNYFRAIVAKGEKSERALELTKDAVKLNASNYTVWQYRRDILRNLNADLYKELEYVEDVIIDSPKNYQVWHHRREIVEMLKDPSLELQLTEEVLTIDSKNYHAWQHRQWAIKTYNLFDDELTFVDKLIATDIRNNSAWNQRFFVLKHTGFTVEVLEREVHYTMNRIKIVKNNESSWNFLRGLLQEGEGTLDQFPEVVEFAEELLEKDVKSPYLVAFLIDMYQEIALRESTDEVERKRAINKSTDLCKSMMTDLDTIRNKYWEFMLESFTIKLNAKFNQ